MLPYSLTIPFFLPAFPLSAFPFMKRHLPHQLTVFLDPLYQKSPFTEDNDHEASGKQRIEEDELSISPSGEDINEFLEVSNPKEAEVTAKTTEPKEEVELLKSLEAAFTDDLLAPK